MKIQSLHDCKLIICGGIVRRSQPILLLSREERGNNQEEAWWDGMSNMRVLHRNKFPHQTTQGGGTIEIFVKKEETCFGLKITSGAQKYLV